MTGNAVALDFGTEITTWDKQGDGSTGWHGNQEDNEVEPPSTIGQNWDLEGMFYNGTSLTMVGGWDFINGIDDWDSGDIFIDTNNDVLYGERRPGDPTTNGNHTVDNNYGYEYALDVNWGAGTFDIIGIDANTDVLTSYYAANRSSNPYRLAADPGSSDEFDFTSGSYAEGSDDDTLCFTGGGTHYWVTFDIGSITDFNLAHFTQKCGNDNLVGAVPEPATFLLSGMGVFLRRKYSAKA